MVDFASVKKVYTSVFRAGNYLYIREIQNGKRRKFKIEYKPTLYITTTKNTTLHAPDGTPVEAICPGTMQDCYQFLQKYKGVANFRVYGNTSYEYAYINETYPTHIDYKWNELVICNLDIEVESKMGFSEAKDALNEVQAITMKCSTDGIFHVFACQPFNDTVYNTEHTDTKILYHQCTDELDLLNNFLDLWETLEPDIVTGWNIRMYDIPYLINRITRVMSFDDSKRLSPWNQVRESTVNIFNKAEVVYDVAGLCVLDYLLIYRKNVLEPRESYRLDYIAEVELGERKLDYSEHGSLQELYEKDFKKFIEYNIHDVRLVDRIDAKRKLIELQLIVAYHAHVNYVDVLSQVRTWDTLICNHLLAQGCVIPQKTDIAKDAQFTGAFVMKPTIGMHEWIASFDVQSLYPMIMRTLNMGMETKLTYKELTPLMRKYQLYLDSHLMVADEEGKYNVNPDAIVEGVTEELWAELQAENVSVSANGVFYRRDPKSFYSVMIEELFQNRLDYKKKLKEAKNALSELVCLAGDDPQAVAVFHEKKAEYETQASIYDLKQHAIKILLNSLYGAMGNQYFRFFDVKNAEAVTTTGQFIIQYIGRGIDAYLNKKMQCNPPQKFVVYSDTDSVYVTLKTVVDKFCPDGDMMTKVEFVDNLCKQAIQKEINRLFRLLTERYLNGVGEYLLMNREVIGDKGIWTAKKRYLVNVRDKEGIRKNPAELKYMGVEIAKSSVPKFCRDAMKAAVTIVMEQDQKTLFKFVKATKKKFKAQCIEDVSFPRSVNGLEKYGDPKTIYTKGTPFHTKGVLIYNALIDKYGLESKYPKIKDGEKMKFFYLQEPNPVNGNAMAFITSLPPEFDMHQYIDWETQWEKSFLEPLMLILNAIGWDTQPRASLKDVFGDAEVCPKCRYVLPDNGICTNLKCQGDQLQLDACGVCGSFTCKNGECEMPPSLDCEEYELTDSDSVV
jgi:DNA polymerase elongation subunit (family B)